jgi:hypothetical protein
MSLYPSQFFNASSSFWIPYGAVSTGTTFAPGLDIDLGNISTLNTQHIQLDSVSMDASPANGGTLLLNGVALVTGNNNISSIANWAGFPAMSTIQYTAGGGNLIMNSITSDTINANTGTISTINSALTVTAASTNTTSISSSSLTVSSINGLAYPSTLLPQLSISTAPLANGYNNFAFDMSSVAPGFYLVKVSIQSGNGTDPFTCSAMIGKFGAASDGGSFHCPSIGGAAPSFANYVSIQDAGSANNTVNVIVQTNDVGTIGQIVQISAYRIT